MKEVTIRDENYIQIAGWMLNELDLKGNELLIYALIHGFSQDGKSDYHGGLTYISLWTNSTKQGVIKALKSLLEKGLIVKDVYFENGTQYVRYWTVKSRENVKTTQTKSGKQSLPNTNSTEFTTKQEDSDKQSLMGVNSVYHTQSTKFNGGGKQSLPYKNSEILDENSSASAVESNTKKAAADFIKNKLLELFEGHFIFDDNFVPELYLLSRQFGLTEIQTVKYIDFVFEKAKDKEPKSLTNMFYKMAKSANIMQDFVLELEKSDSSDSKKTIICPVCGSKAESYGICPHCDFDMNDRFDAHIVNLKKQIFKLSEPAREAFKAEYYAELERQSSFGITAFINNPELKIEFSKRLNEIYKKYGITA
ncbi:MAG: hypothetical protein K6C98_02525 [Treponema sp.]|nr:hypothetical protein [Treponema sp.]